MVQRSLRVIYAVNARLPGGGVGNVAYHDAVGVQQSGHLQQLIASSLRDQTFANSRVSTLGLLGRAFKRLGLYDPTGYVYALDGALFDQFAARQLTDCDIVHSWHTHSYWTQRKAKQKGAVTILQSGSTHPLVQKQLLEEESRRWGGDYHYLMSRHGLDEIVEADYVIIPSEFARDTFVEHGKPSDRVICLPFGVNIDQFQVRPAEYVSDVFRVIFVGQVSVRKGIPYLLEAWRKLGWSGAELLVIGRADPMTQNLLRTYSMPENVRWLTHSTELWKWYHASDVFVFPSIEEGSALVTYEAMACGLPILTTYNAGSVARDGQEGFIVPIRDVDALSARLQQLRDDHALRGQLGRSARARIEEFTWQRRQRQLIDIYHQIGAAYRTETT